MLFPDSSDSDIDLPRKTKRFVPPKLGPQKKLALSPDDPESPEISEDELPPKPHKNTLSESILDSNSVGFKIMQKMGFSMDGRLGAKHNPNALREPLPIKKRKVNSGIVPSKTVQLQNADSAHSAAYTQSRKSALAVRESTSMIRKLQKFCFESSGDDSRLVAGEDIDLINPLWREFARKEVDPDHAPTPVDVEQLTDLLRYARATYFYCPYCGIKFEDFDDLSLHCPGPSKEDHPI